MNNDPNRRTVLLTIAFIVTLLVPNCVLAGTEPYSAWSKAALVVLPTGLFMIWSVLSRRSGTMIWLALPFIFLCAFQIVLLYLFGNSIIATDMFTNLLTTNPGEATELLSNIYPSVIIVCLIYVPVLWLALIELKRHRIIPLLARRIIGISGAVIAVAGILLLFPAYRANDDRNVLRTEIFPFNVIYNLNLSFSEYAKVRNYERTSDDFSFRAQRSGEAGEREIYVLVIGEASRAVNWQLYGYGRPTTPNLCRTTDLVVFRNMLTQSNTTHKSVPMILSSTPTERHEELYLRKGMPAIFREAGFKTWFISNQSRQGAMIDKLAADADSQIYIRSPRYDCQMLDTMRRIVETDDSERLFFILHSYGSHFSYHQRYPRQFARFLPDDDVAITHKNIEMIRNAYDNSILYTDHFLSQLIEYLRSLDACTAMLYTADHGEDLLDDDRDRFLHASPTTTFYQLYVASVGWFSPSYCAAFPEKAQAAREHVDAPATTRSLFHTIADIASIESPYLDRSVSLVSEEFDYNKPRYYLNDHNLAKPFPKTGLDAHDSQEFARHGIKL